VIRGRWLRSGGGGLCLVLGVSLVAACGAGDQPAALHDGAAAPPVEVMSVDPEPSPDPPTDAASDPDAASEPDIEPDLGGRTVGWSSVDDAPALPGRPSSACDSGAAIDSGVHLRRWHDVDRQVIVRVPEPGAPQGHPPPVVFNLHGSAATAAGHDAYVHFSAPAAARGYVVLTPEGMPPEEGGLQVWELFPGIYPDDPGYLASLVDWVGEAMCVDLDRVYATGFSNGSTLTNVVACHTQGRFRAIGAVAAHRFPIVCPSGPVSVIGIHGTGDVIVPYLGGPLLRRPEFWMPPVEETFTAWAQNGRCDIAPRHEEVVPDVVRRRWTGCAEGIQVELYAIEGGGHSWPWVDDPLYPAKIDATTLILDFFDAN
jgi:poly(3-hydroxybutyrate) depolymerase